MGRSVGARSSSDIAHVSLRRRNSLDYEDISGTYFRLIVRSNRLTAMFGGERQ